MDLQACSGVDSSGESTLPVVRQDVDSCTAFATEKLCVLCVLCGYKPIFHDQGCG